jgi:hypothetical protein
MVRRMLLWGSLAALAALAVWAVRRFAAGYPPGVTPALCLAPRELATVAAAAEATFPRGGAIAPSGLDAGIPAYVDRFVAAQQGPTRLLMRLLFALVEHATIVFPAPGPGGRRRFSRLDAAQRVQVLDGWRKSRLFPRRLVFTSLRAILTMGYFSDPVVLRELGLMPRDVPRRVCEADLLWPPVGQPRTAIRWTPADVTPRGTSGVVGAPAAGAAASATPRAAGGEGAP